MNSGFVLIPIEFKLQGPSLTQAPSTALNIHSCTESFLLTETLKIS